MKPSANVLGKTSGKYDICKSVLAAGAAVRKIARAVKAFWKNQECDNEVRNQ